MHFPEDEHTSQAFVLTSKILGSAHTCSEKDTIVSLSIINKDDIKKNKSKTKDEKSEVKAKEKFILSITENGFGKAVNKKSV